jgi:hypothetical protein
LVKRGAICKKAAALLYERLRQRDSFAAAQRADRESQILIQEGKKKKVVSRNYRLTKSKNCEY